MQIQVTRIVSRREFGTIFAGTVVEPDSERSGVHLRVKAGRNALSGEPIIGEVWDVDGPLRQTAWGTQIDAIRAVRVLPSGALICDFLAAHIPGIGSQRAQELWKHFGEELPTYLSSEDHIELVARILAPDRPVLAPRLAALIIRAWRDAAGEAHLAEWLSSHGFEDARLVRLMTRLMGPEAQDRLVQNPYCLVPILPWPKVDRIGLRILAETGSPKPHEDVRRLVGAVDATVKRTILDGSTALDDEELRRGVARILGVGLQSGRVAAAITAGERNTAILRHGDLWRAPGAASMEEAVTERLRSMLCPSYPRPITVPAPETLACMLGRFEENDCPLHTEQRQAVVRVLQSTVSCLQGGAGVGKTYTTRVICDVWETLGGRVLLCALAGKAALRLSRSTGRMARTLARTLGDLSRREAQMREVWEEDLDAAQFARIESQLKVLANIDERTLVIIDEASMVDLPTMHALLRWMPKGSRLLLVGDEAQLPPVGFGLVYHRMVLDPALTTKLVTVHRQAAETGIPEAAAAVRAGRTPSFTPYTGPATGVSLVPCVLDRLAETVEAISLELGGPRAGTLIVTATNEGLAGVEALNMRLHQRHLATTGHPAIKGHLGRWLSAGEPVIHLRNEYTKGLFNGLLGTIQAVDAQTRSCTVLFDGEEDPHEFTTDDLLDLSLAYAITCHKAQGSSAPRVVIPLYHTRVLDPSWVYTAMTRAEQQIIFVGDVSILEEALRRDWTANRRRIGFEWPSVTSTHKTDFAA